MIAPQTTLELVCKEDESRRVHLSNKLPFVFIGGPCQIESEEHAYKMVNAIANITTKLGIPFVYKSSFDKANRTSVDGKRGVGMARGLRILADIARHGIPTLTDVHEIRQVEKVADAVQIIQIPAFLCRQTDLLIEAGKTGKIINIKKGQFLSPEEMKYAIDKVQSTGNPRILVTERGTTFGYNNLVVDFRSLRVLAEFGYPVVMDATHSAQRPGVLSGHSGGVRLDVPYLARAAVACGVAAVFAEVHDDPDNAPSDGPNSLHLNQLEKFLEQLDAIDQVVK